MKVAVVHNLTEGGARRRLEQQMRALDPSLSLTEYTLSTASPITESARVIPLRQLASHYSQRSRPALRYWDLFALFRSYQRLSQVVAAHEPDVIWLNPCQFLQAPRVVIAGIPTFYYCDEPRRADYDQHARDLMNPATRLLYRPKRHVEKHADRNTVEHVDRIASNSQFSARQIETNYGVPATVIYCGVDQGVFSPTDGRPAHFLSVGTLIESKGHDIAIDAVAQSGIDLPLIIVGSKRTSAERARLEQRARDQNVALRIVSGIDDAELAQLYREAMATLYLAANEPFGLVSLEAQAAGCPVVVADEGGLPETVEPLVTGFVVERLGSSAALALKALGDDTTRRSMQKAARKNAQRFTWKASANAVGSTLQSLVHEP